MEFLSQTVFAFTIIVYIYNSKGRKNKKTRILYVLSLICLAAYIVAYLYLLFEGRLSSIKVFALFSVICCSAIAIWHYVSWG